MLMWTTNNWMYAEVNVSYTTRQCRKSSYDGNESVLELLLQNSCIHVNVKGRLNNATPLHVAMYEPSRVSIVEKLIAHPCIAINEMNNGDETLLDLVKRLIEWVKTMDDPNDNDSDDIGIEHKDKLLSDYLHIQMLLEEFPVKRCWEAYVFILSKAEMV
jgi:hypothetical protein